MTTEHATINEYREASLSYLRDASDALSAGNYPNASEKLWGAAAQMVKAVAESRGWAHNGHRQLFQVVSQLTDETGDTDLAVLFRAAGFLHTNFYERWLPPEDVELAREQVVQLLEKLELSIEVPA